MKKNFLKKKVKYKRKSRERYEGNRIPKPSAILRAGPPADHRLPNRPPPTYMAARAKSNGGLVRLNETAYSV